MLYAEGKHAVLIVFQAMDAGGKDGAIDHVFSGDQPAGVLGHQLQGAEPPGTGTRFPLAASTGAPPQGMIGIFNRSHYESVLVERVKKLVPEDVWSDRYDHINDFEKMLADEGTMILKFFLHISKDEQKERLQARLDDPAKNWKFNPGDLNERKLLGRLPGGVRGRDREVLDQVRPRGTSSRPTASGSATG